MTKKVIHRGKRSMTLSEVKLVKNMSKKLERRPRITVKLSFRELYGSKLTGLYPFDNMAIIQ